MKLITKLLQRHVAAFEDEFNAIEAKNGAANDAERTVRAAAAAGWFTKDIDDIGEMTPRDVRKLAKDVNQAYLDAISLDPN
jgi:hypothetical protein